MMHDASRSGCVTSSTSASIEDTKCVNCSSKEKKCAKYVAHEVIDSNMDFHDNVGPSFLCPPHAKIFVIADLPFYPYTYLVA